MVNESWVNEILVALYVQAVKQYHQGGYDPRKPEHGIGCRVRLFLCFTLLAIVMHY
jgi:hypothetical protein